MLSENYSWREKRGWLHSIGMYPYYVNTKQTTLPEGNAHYSLYGIKESDAMKYQELFTKSHHIYEHYSSELIIDAESTKSLEQIVDYSSEHSWSFKVYETGSRNGGGHIAIERDAVPSETLYMRDRCFVMQNFGDVSDIDVTIYNSPMHLIRGISKVHEITKQKKKMLYAHTGRVTPSVQTLEIYDVLLKYHEKRKQNLKIEIESDWTKFQRLLQKHSPNNLTSGKKYSSIFILCKDLFKCGLDMNHVQNVVAFFVSNIEESPRDDTVNRAIEDAYKAINKAGVRK